MCIRDSFTLQQGQQEVPVDGRTVGGWTFTEGSQPYSGYAERQGTRVYPGNGRITNYGSGDSGPGNPEPEPGDSTGVVNTGGSSYVNLRSGPSLARSVVGRADDGQRLTVSCQTQGGSVQGLDGPTSTWFRLAGGEWVTAGFVSTSGSIRRC